MIIHKYLHYIPYVLRILAVSDSDSEVDSPLCVQYPTLALGTLESGQRGFVISHSSIFRLPDVEGQDLDNGNVTSVQWVTYNESAPDVY